MWDAAKTNRLNSLHWTNAQGELINSALADELSEMWDRCDLESRNNAFIEGVIQTHGDDIVGKVGPSLQVTVDSRGTDANGEPIQPSEIDRRFVNRLEEDWRTFSARPEVTDTMSLVQILRLWVRSLWTRGEYIAQIARDDDQERLQLIDSRRCYTPVASFGDDDITLGVKRNRVGKPELYWFADRADGAYQFNYSLSGQWYSAADVIHCFEVVEAGQVRGVPWLSPVLPALAQLRDYDNAVLDAAENAAEFGVVLSTDHPDSSYVEYDGTLPLERRQMTTAPPGWRATMVNPQQPSTLYTDYRRERLRELGRVRSMPVLKVLLDAGSHNMSSAHFDAEQYHRGCRCIQGLFEDHGLNALIATRINRLALTEFGGYVPAGLQTSWGWPRPLHPDPQKSAKAREIDMSTGVLPFSIACEEDGRDPRDVVKAHAMSDRLWQEAGLDAPPHFKTNGMAQPQGGEPEAPHAEDEPGKGRLAPYLNGVHSNGKG